jgi:photosystem II stability/assembly factor-like uncharacterized protein
MVYALAKESLQALNVSTTECYRRNQMLANNFWKREVMRVEWATQSAPLGLSSIKALTVTLASGLQRPLISIYSLLSVIRDSGEDPTSLLGPEGGAESKAMTTLNNRVLRLAAAWFKGSLVLFGCCLLSCCNSGNATQATNSRDVTRDRITETEVTRERPEQFSHVQLLSRTHWVVMDFKSVWKTEDAGKSWKRTLGPAEKEEISGDFTGGLSFVNEQTGFVVLNHKLFGTVDGGNSWTRVNDANLGASNIFFRDAMTGWAAGFDWTENPVQSQKVLYVGKLWRTRDGGRHWETLLLPTVYMDTNSDRWALRDVCFSDDLNGWAVGSGVFLHSSDGGKTWKELKIHDDLVGIAFANRDLGWAVWRESGEFRLTTDGGKTWKPNDKIVQNVNGRVVFVNERIGFAIENSVRLIGTTDGGENWESVNIENDPVAELETASDFSVYLERAKDGTLVAIWLMGRPKGVISVVSTDTGKTWFRNS